jgi:16S rRNA (guanine527-N7)-methyltransferase
VTEEEARNWVASGFGREAKSRLAWFVDRLSDAAEQQNLISASSHGAIWARHIVDSAQLVPLAVAASDGPWVDVGAGAGLPGLVVACLVERPVILIEPRRLRVAFLEETAAALGLADRVTVLAAKSERVTLQSPAAIISARAVAALPQLLANTVNLAGKDTLWLLPKGRNATSEVAEAQRSWHGRFHVKPSVTDAASGIVVAQGVSRR